MPDKLNPILKLKEWLTIPEAAKHLSILFETEVGELDILRLGLDMKLKLSVYLKNSVMAKYGQITSYEPPDYFNKMIENDNFSRLVRCSSYLNNQRHLSFELKDYMPIDGVWDLAMIGNEMDLIEYEYNKLSNGLKAMTHQRDGVFVENMNDHGMIYQIQERFDDEFINRHRPPCPDMGEYIEKDIFDYKDDKYEEDLHKYLDERKKNQANEYYPAGELPSDSALVVRTEALLDLYNEAIGKKKKPIKDKLNEKEETTYLNIIGALLNCITGCYKNESFSSEAQLREFLAHEYKKHQGISERTLAGKFTLAKRMLDAEI